jgi:hypothetical protein
MGVKEFTVEDFSWEFEQKFYEDYNQYCKQNQLVVEGTEEGLEIRSFVNAYSVVPEIGKNYYFVTLLWTMEPGHKFISIANLADQYKLEDIKDDGQLIVRNVKTNILRTFPETTGPVAEKTKCSVLFLTDKEKDDFLFILNLRFSDWKIVGSIK